jgi:hypothetical protein
MLTRCYKVLSTTAKLHHRTPLPPGTTLEQTLVLFRNHDLLIHLDPELASYTTADPPADAPNPKTKYYRITDNMQALPKGLWDTTVAFDAEITDIDNGVEWVIRAPLGLLQRSTWTVEPALEADGAAAEGGALVLVEDVLISCSRLLVGTVRGKCEDNWRGVHARFLRHLAELK